MADFLELISFARRLLGVPADLIADQVTTTADKCTVLFADGQTASFRIVEIQEGRRIIQRPAVLVELESGEPLPNLSVKTSGNKTSTGGASKMVSDPRKRETPKDVTEDRVEDYVAPIDGENAAQQPSTSSGIKNKPGMMNYPMFCEQESKKPRLYYNVICKCPKADKPDTASARDTLRRKAMLGALVRGSPRKLRPIPIRTKSYAKNLKPYKVTKLPVQIKSKATSEGKVISKEPETSTAPPQPVESVPPTTQETIPPEPVEPAQQPEVDSANADQPAEGVAPPSSPVQPPTNTESEVEFRQFMRERIWSMKEAMQKMSELQEATQAELQSIKQRNEQLEKELRETREREIEREDEIRREEEEYELEQEEERRHREEYRERYGHDDQEEETHYEPRRVVSNNFENINERATLIDGNTNESNTNERTIHIRPTQNSTTIEQTRENLNQPRVENIGLLERDSTKLEYHLTQSKNYKMWRSIFDMELGLKRLSDVVDENAPPPRAYTQIEMNERRKIVRGIIISHVDESYQEQIIELENPKDMLDKIYKMKREEINDTTVSVKDQLRNLKFQMGVDTVFNFNTKFDDLVRRYELVSGTSMSEIDKRDAYYHSVSKSVPSIKEATYRDRAKGEGDGFSFEEMRIYIQQVEAENRNALQVNRGRGSLMVATEAQRCFKCGDRGHHSSNCTRRQGEFKCYRCEGFGHKSFQCPNNRQARYGKRSNSNPQNDGGGNKRFKQTRYDNSRRGGYARRGRGSYFGNRRNQSRIRSNLDNFNRESNHSENQNQNYKRGNFRRGRGRRRGNYQNNSERENKPYPNQNSNHSNSRTGVSNRSEQQDKKVMPVQNQANLVVPPPTAPNPLPPPPIPMPFWFMPPQPPIFNIDPNVNYSTIEDRLNQIRKEEERQRASQDVTATKKKFQERQDRRDRDDGDNGAAYMAGGSRGRGKKNSLYISFIADSGACDHIIKETNILQNYISLQDTLRSANVMSSADLQIRGEGDLYVHTNTKERMPFRLLNVKYSPNISENLLSLRKFTDLGFTVKLTKESLYIYHPTTRETLLTGYYSKPSWIVELDLIDKNNIDQEMQKFEEYNESYLQNAILEIGSSEQFLGSGGAEQKVEENSEEIEKSQDITDEQKHISENSNSEKVTTENSLNINNNVSRRVNPNITRETTGLDQPILTSYNETETSSVLDTEKFIDTIDESILQKEKLKQTPGFLLHVKLGHASMQYLKELKKRDEKLKNIVLDESINECETCALTKAIKLPFNETRTRAIRPLQVIHADLMGPIKPQTFPGKYRYICVFVDDFSRLAMAYAMESKDKTGFYFEKFVTSARNMLGEKAKICYLQSDQGTEFTGGYIQEFLEREGIEQTLAPPYTPQHNGVAERFNRTLITKIRAMILDSGFPSNKWDLVLRAAVFLYNRTPHRSNEFNIPLEKFNPNTPCHTEQIKRFGCIAYMLLPKSVNTPKFSQRAVRVIFVGYLASGYLLYHPQSNTYFESKHVRFRETMLYKHAYPSSQNSENVQLEIEEENIETKTSDKREEIGKTIENENTERETQKRKANTDETTKRKKKKEENLSNIQMRAMTKLKDTSFTSFSKDPEETKDILFVPHFEESNILHTDKRDEISHLTLATTFQDPTTFTEAINSPEKSLWLEAIKDEFKSLSQNKVWFYTDRPQHKKIIDSRWLFKMKESQGEKKCKARLVIRGFKDTNDYELRETYAPVARRPTVFLTLAIINKLNLEVSQMDVKTAFLNGRLTTEEIYMEIPEGIECSEKFKREKVCKLERALYGLRISPQKWNQLFTEFMATQNFIACPSDPCLFKWKEGNNFTILLLYVDDMIIASNSKKKLSEIKEGLNKKFEMVDLGEPSKYLGLEIKRERNTKIMNITQTKFIDKILQRFNMSDCKMHDTPMVTRGNEIKFKSDEGKIVEAPYREAIGSMLYLCGGTRPDMSYAINVLSRKQLEPTEADWIAVKRTFRYSKATRELGLVYKGEKNGLELFTDSSFADCEGSLSTSGYIIRLFGDTIAWRSHKQNFVAMSTCEAEFVSMSEGVMELMAVHKVIEFILDESFCPIRVWCDNKAAVDCVSLAQPLKIRHCLAKNADYVKHAENERKIKVQWLPSTSQLADIMTKALPNKTHILLRNQILNT
ncbi:hypothetical protein V9T40_003019 [Parthenolecanium corni]|uniref:Uncharacterized protein n=1 Tax=Parthenolecanium corni TaxID=536013 RepID=A0AAN9YA23_9HEMI